jgi:hypothetical protein
VHITALYLPLAAQARIGTLHEPVLTPRAAAALSIPRYQMPLVGADRAAWLRHRLAALNELGQQSAVSPQKLSHATLVMVASRLPPVQTPAAAPAPDCGSEPLGRSTSLWIHAPGAGALDAEKTRALRAQLAAFLHRTGLQDTPVLLDCEIAADRPDGADDAGLLRLDRMRPVVPTAGLGILGDLLQDPDGRIWAMQPYVSQDDSRAQAFAAQLNRACGAKALDVRLAAAPGGLVYAAMEVPPGLRVLPRPLRDAAMRASLADDIAADAWLANVSVYGDPQRRIGQLDARAVRMSTPRVMETFGTPQCRGMVHGEAVVRELFLLLRSGDVLHPLRPSDGADLRRLFDQEITLAQLAGGIRRVLRVNDDTIRELAGRYGMLEPRGRREQVAHLIARRDVLATLSFLDRTDLDFYEDGTSPHDTRGIVVSRIVADEIAARRIIEKPALRPVAPRRLRDASVPHLPDAAVIDTALRLARDPDFLRAPMSRGFVRWVYRIPGHPFVFKFSRRGAEAVLRWRELFSGGVFPEAALAEGVRHAERLNQRYGRMVEHLGADLVYAEHAMVIPDVAIPSELLTGLAAEPYALGPTTTLPILAAIQSVFPYIDAPGTLQCRFPYSEWNPTLPDFGASAIDPRRYGASLDEWVLNLRPPSDQRPPIERLMQVHPRSTADVFLAQCRKEPALHALARRFWTDLIGSYCPSTGESADTSGPENALWYLDEHGERRLALVDFLYPDDCPILLDADPIMRRFLRGEPLVMQDRSKLLNAVNFARGANFMASALDIDARIDLFPDRLLKDQISARAQDVFRLFNTMPIIRLQPHPDQPWGVY